jgi:hypothetical protein
MFLAPADGLAYCEFNFAPSTCWAAYQFDGYRQGMRALEQQPPVAVAVAADSGRLELSAICSLPEPSTASDRIGLCAVIEDAGGLLSYWALSHHAEQPDFHDPASFVALQE